MPARFAALFVEPHPLPIPDRVFPLEVEALYCAHHGWLLGWLSRKLAHAGDAAELAQDTFVRVMSRPRDLGEIREPRAWLTTIAHGLAVDHVRRRTIERACLEAIASLSEAHAPSPETRLLLFEALVRIDAMLDGLSPKAREAFLLSRLDGLTYTEIAYRLGVSLSSVEKYMASAIRHCVAER